MFAVVKILNKKNGNTSCLGTISKSHDRLIVVSFDMDDVAEFARRKDLNLAVHSTCGAIQRRYDDFFNCGKIKIKVVVHKIVNTKEELKHELFLRSHA